MLESSERLSGLAKGANPSQSSWMRSTLGLTQLRRLRLKLFVMEGGWWWVKIGEGWLLLEMSDLEEIEFSATVFFDLIFVLSHLGLFRDRKLGVTGRMDKGDGWLRVE